MPATLPGGTMLDFNTLWPMLLTERRAPFSDLDWAFEIKYDGYRLMASIDNGTVRLRSRGGADATKWFPEIVRGLAKLPGRQVLDGEVCVLDEFGRSDFGKLHARAKRRGYRAGDDFVAYFAFDILVANGSDVIDLPLRERRELLHVLMDSPPDSVRVVGSLNGDGEFLFSSVLSLELEGIVGKRLDSPYLPGVRSADWVKVKRPSAVPTERFKLTASGR